MASFSSIQMGLLGAELAICLSAVALFGFAYPDRLRTRLWENGGVEGWNSNPNLRIYFYANYKEPPEIPIIWSERLTESTLAIAILSLVICFARASTVRLRYLPQYASISYDALLCALWMFSTAIQNSGDWSDPEHVSHHPWYLTRGCAASWKGNRTICHVAQASFVVSVAAVIVYGMRLLIGGSKLLQELMQPRDPQIRGYKYYTVEELELLKVIEANRVQEQALSPVLAFFPESPMGSRY